MIPETLQIWKLVKSLCLKKRKTEENSEILRKKNADFAGKSNHLDYYFLILLKKKRDTFLEVCYQSTKILTEKKNTDFRC